MLDESTVGARVRFCRRQRIWSESVLAYKANLTPEIIGQIEAGTLTPEPKQVLQIANALQASLDYLMHGKKTETAKPGGPVMVIACGRNRSISRCEVCRAPVTVQCDFPVKRDFGSQTCDRFLCSVHSVKSGKLDYCYPHARLAGVIDDHPKTNDMMTGQYKELKSKYSGTCSRCFEPIEVDGVIFWRPGETYCKECGEELGLSG